LFWVTIAGLPTATAVLALRLLAPVASRWQRPPPGYATTADLARATTAAAVLRRTPQVRPDLTGRRIEVTQVASLLGTDARSGRRLYRSYEDNAILAGPTRMGKTACLAGQVIDADGPVVVTSTRTDLLWVTAAARGRRGPVLVWEPEGKAGWPDPMRWSPVTGCADPGRAQLRAAAMVAGARVGQDVTDGGTWQEIATEILSYYLHAAALGGRSMRDILSWAANPADETPQAILRDSRVGTSFWYGRLAAHAAADPRLVSNMWFGVSLALKCVTHPQVLRACCPPPSQSFDPAAFIRSGGGLYLLGSRARQAPVAPLVTALVEELVETARELGNASEHDRLAPPLHLFLDEVTNIAPLPSLPSLLSDGAGAGIPVTAAVQSPAQLQERWGDRGAQAMWDNATCKLLFGGSAYPDVLEDISRLCGEYDQPYEVRTSGGAFNPAHTSASWQPRRQRVVPIEDLYTLPPLTALLLARATRPTRLAVQPWWTRPDADLLRADQARLKATRHRPSSQDNR
jgi:type IV secretory pathway TraG/TraD family ATPase VirD4